MRPMRLTSEHRIERILRLNGRVIRLHRRCAGVQTGRMRVDAAGFCVGAAVAVGNDHFRFAVNILVEGETDEKAVGVLIDAVPALVADI